MGTSIDERIVQAFAAEPIDEGGIRQLAADTFRGRLKWLSVMTCVWMTAVLILGAVCLVKLLRATDAVASVRWGVGVMACMLAVGVMKTWLWLFAARNALLREIKRVELRVLESKQSRP